LLSFYPQLTSRAAGQSPIFSQLLGARGKPRPQPGDKGLMIEFCISALYFRPGQAHEFSVILK
jgi:hypothetical protein